LVRTPLGTITSYDGPAENTEPPKLLLAVGHPAAVADGCLNFFRTLVNGALSKRDRKLVTLAVAAAIENAYEWGHHTPTALTMDITQADLDAIKSGETDKLAKRDRVVVEVSQAVEHQNVTDELWAQAEAEFDTEQLVQLTVISAYYGMLGRIQNALQVDQDEGFASTY
jgi:alkylhydroperoxidase family enzyme